MPFYKQTNFQNNYKHINFKGKKPDEEVILLLRRHWLVFIFRFFPFFLGFLFLIIVNQIGPVLFEFFGLDVDVSFFYFFISFLGIVLWLATFITWVNFYLDVWIVTDSRIINIEQAALFSRHISELKHNKIQDVTSEVKGIFPTLFNYGDVYIQTAGNKARFAFWQIPKPNYTRNIVVQLQKRAILEEKRQEGEIMRGKS
jgi:hypothetical protein